MVPYLLSNHRRQRYELLGDNIMAYNLSKEIHFPYNSVDVIYHSHMLEHLDRSVVPEFYWKLIECLSPVSSPNSNARLRVVV